MQLLDKYADSFGFNRIPHDIPAPAIGGDTCLVIGTAPCWREDYEAAIKAFPQAELCAINDAAGFMKVQHISSVHGRFMKGFYNKQKALGGNAYLHKRRECGPEGLPHYHWRASIVSGSGPFSAAIMAVLGYTRVIMCGCPINGNGGYAAGVNIEEIAIWNGAKPESIEKYHNAMREFKKVFPEIAERIRSMSGATQEIFGGI